ncbi:AraC family transcriptional regulator [uncultured Aquimarina sp.]|uniref:AraC family transcriptional regulator n=1 Tax=uncultured Aquimarina sp. TaxID=575652 RepID=UPI00262585AA|nr:AraC family transcriptional regulator [uncultured Aquimarina sp.]
MCLLFQGADIECKKNLIPYQRTTGDMFYYEAGENHKTISTIKDSKNINIEFKIDKLKKEKIYLSPNFDSVNKNPAPKLLFLHMLSELLTNDNTSSASLEALAFQLFEFENSAKNDNKPKWVVQMDEYFNENWASDFSLIDLATAIGVHPITISKNFKKYYRCTFGEYRRMLKIHNSIPLIKNSTMRLSQIAYECGFSDQSHFVRNFKKYASFLPKDFRRI